jgi:hypothetical protein
MFGGVYVCVWRGMDLRCVARLCCGCGEDGRCLCDGVDMLAHASAVTSVFVNAMSRRI